MAGNWRHGCWQLGLVVVLGVEAAIASTVKNCVYAQVLPDTTLPVNSTVFSTGNNFTINGGTQAGGNLFHSFSQFSVPTNGSAFFNNAQTIQNIISRVTGSSVSNIDGILRANGTANLFLLNPQGIVFGPNARLNLGGSFVASTASSLNFADGTKFSATTPENAPLLTVSVPIGLQFGENPQRILVQGNGQGLRRMEDPIIDTQNALRVQPNQTLALVGGNVALEGGTLKTAGGQIEIGSIAAPGLVSLIPTSKGFSLNYDNVSSYGDIQLSRAAAVDASGSGGGDIQLRGRQVTLQGGSQIESSTLNTAPGGTLKITASELVEISGSTADNPQDNRRFPSSLSTDNREAGEIPGELTINTRQLIVRNGARVSASTLRAGNGGNINVNASESVQLIGTGISPGGLRSSGLSVQTRGAGNAGNLTINTRRLIIKDGAEASASTFGRGNGGVVSVKAFDSVEVSGTSANGQLRSRLVAGVGNPADILREGSPPPVSATGRGGNLAIATFNLNVTDGAIVAVSSRSTAPNAQGAGNLQVNAKNIRLNNQGAISAETFSGQGGNITLQVEDFLLLRRNSQISATAGTAQQGGNGGNITIDTPFIISAPLENSDITANAFSGQGGKVTINATDIFFLESLSRDELSRQLGRSGTQLDPNRLQTNDITAISQDNPNLNGQVNINTPDIDPSRGLIALPAVVVNSPGLVASNCNAFIGKKGSEFTITGRGGLPLSPDDFLSSDVVWSDTRLSAMTTQRQDLNTSTAKFVARSPVAIAPGGSLTIVPATNWIFNNKGEVTLISQVSDATAEHFTSTSATCLRR
ncbi:filamentous hemagglutinin N-terminal domain-containing protein [Hassallia byssoidea VB512170]|uniref:Filamentous hemagglutinin N-terminal domain-containing protein n=1 Tax=Hassallia byssoidea VB512170 TaxID=1304833 RepID=A0A846HDJ6_9CYAN|nr:filamentous hemagglutinin N-terminal domain-containing protein [Hassalia byssoidea]NEU75637.1 filamentous hemagglutinin N-terminal domain-containing protein [Hassalia byssoidea VB512170]